MLAGVVLAAGESSRMGRPKAMLDISGVTFLEAVLRTLRAAAVKQVLVTVAQNGSKYHSSIDLTGVSVLVNTRNTADGQIGSVRTAVEWLINRTVDGAVIIPVDHPCVSVPTVRSLMAAFLRTAFPIVVPTSLGKRGHPLVVSRAVFGELLSPVAEGGANAVVRRDPARVLEVPVEDQAILDDVDTPQDYERLMARFLGSPSL